MNAEPPATAEAEAAAVVARVLKKATDGLRQQWHALTPSAQALARRGLLRHCRACQRFGLRPDPQAVREIIELAERVARLRDALSEEN